MLRLRRVSLHLIADAGSPQEICYFCKKASSDAVSAARDYLDRLAETVNYAVHPYVGRLTDEEHEMEIAKLQPRYRMIHREFKRQKNEGQNKVS